MSIKQGLKKFWDDLDETYEKDMARKEARSKRRHTSIALASVAVLGLVGIHKLDR